MIQRAVATAVSGRQRIVSSSRLRGAMSSPQNSGNNPTAVAATRRAIAVSTAGRQLSSLPNQHWQVTASTARWLSTEMRAQTAAAAAANASMADSAGNAGAKKKTEANVFLDNLGKIFLFSIGAVIAALVRSSYNTSNRHLIRDRLEEIAAIDPKELEDFREANSELTLETMRKILSIYYRENARTSGVTSSYEDFVVAIRKIMATRFPKEGEAFTIEMGYYFDRMVVDILEQRGETTESDELPVALFFTAMAAAMNGTVSDRIRILHEIIALEEEGIVGQGVLHADTSSSSSSSSEASKSVPLTKVRDMVGYLQETCQLPPDTQIVPTERKYPTQLWRRATPLDMVPDPSESETENDKQTADRVDLVEFAAILRTKSVCAWGECYMRWKPGASEFETQQQGPPSNGLSVAEGAIAN